MPGEYALIGMHIDRCQEHFLSNLGYRSMEWALSTSQWSRVRILAKRSVALSRPLYGFSSLPPPLSA